VVSEGVYKRGGGGIPLFFLSFFLNWVGRGKRDRKGKRGEASTFSVFLRGGKKRRRGGCSFFLSSDSIGERKKNTAAIKREKGRLSPPPHHRKEKENAKKKEKNDLWLRS